MKLKYRTRSRNLSIEFTIHLRKNQTRQFVCCSLILFLALSFLLSTYRIGWLTQFNLSHRLKYWSALNFFFILQPLPYAFYPGHWGFYNCRLRHFSIEQNTYVEKKMAFGFAAHPFFRPRLKLVLICSICSVFLIFYVKSAVQ